MIRSVAVFCGSRSGTDPAFARDAAVLGRGLAEAGIALVYGGGSNGLMGVLADAALAAGGTVHGVIPEFLMKWEVDHKGVESMQVTDGMHSRKRRMFDMSDAFVILPGGIGTFDEAIEMISWRQLKLHDKPILICDTAGWARPFLEMLRAADAQGFVHGGVLDFIEMVPDAATTLRRLTG